MPTPDLPEFDEVLLSRARLGILSALAGGDEMDFVYLRDALELSDGNLGAQTRNLEQAGYVKVRKRFIDRKPRTFIRITPKGREALAGFLAQLEQVLKSQNSAQDGGPA
jgi:DNA-binding MarR family transcriptional regulator